MGLFDFLKPKKAPTGKAHTEKTPLSDMPTQRKRTFYKELFTVVGTYYYTENIKLLAYSNKDYRKGKNQIKELEMCGKKIFQHYYTNKPVKLIPEPENPYDPLAIKVVIAGEQVGHISREDNKHVHEILSSSDIKYITASIRGGVYKVVSLNGDIFKDEDNVRIKVKIGYAK